MDVDPRVEDLTGSEYGDGENSSEDPLSQPGSSPSGSSSSGSSSLYDDGRQMFISVPIIDVDEAPLENEEPIPVAGPSVVRSRAVAMLPGPSVLTSLIPIEEAVDLNDDVRFIPPHYRGGEAGPDVEVKEESEEETGKVAGTPEFWLITIE
jgi:hypothetical protein